AALHGRLAASLEADGASPARLAHHWHRAGERPAALAASLAAGEEAMRAYAFPEALVHFERALELSDAGPVDRVAVLASAAHAARYLGERERSVALAREALAGFDHDADPARAAQLHRRLGEYHYWDDAEALRCYGRALELASPDQRAEVLAAQGHALM